MRKTTIASIAAVALAATALGALLVGPVTAAGEDPKAWGAGTATSQAFNDGTYTTAIKKKVVAPGDGALMITGVLSTEDSCEAAGTGIVAVRLAVGGTDVWETNDLTAEPAACEFAAKARAQARGIIGPPIPEDTVTVTAVVPVTAGEHMVRLNAVELGGGSYLTSRGLSIVFVPSGSGPVPWPGGEL